MAFGHETSSRHAVKLYVCVIYSNRRIEKKRPRLPWGPSAKKVAHLVARVFDIVTTRSKPFNIFVFSRTDTGKSQLLLQPDMEPPYILLNVHTSQHHHPQTTKQAAWGHLLQLVRDVMLLYGTSLFFLQARASPKIQDHYQQKAHKPTSFHSQSVNYSTVAPCRQCGGFL